MSARTANQYQVVSDHLHYVMKHILPNENFFSQDVTPLFTGHNGSMNGLTTMIIF